MSKQRRDIDVARDAQRFNETYRELKRELRLQGIRNVRTSAKAKAAIGFAATVPLIDKKAVRRDIARRASVRQVTL